MKKIQPVDNWRFWYRKWSFYIIGAIPVLTAAREFFPEIKDAMSPEAYKMCMTGLSVAGFIASQIKQRAIAVPPKEEQP